MPTLSSLLSKYAGVAHARQLAFADFLGKSNWQVDIERGSASFGPGKAFPIQLIGSEARNDNSWLWAWANPQPFIPASVLRTGNQLREMGKRYAIRELTDPGFPLKGVTGHSLAMVASGYHGKAAYYRGPYDGGALYFLVLNLPESIFAPMPSPRVMTVLGSLLMEPGMNNRPTVEAFLASQGFTLTPNGDSIVATREADRCTVPFDSEGRMGKIEFVINGQRAT